MNRFFRPLRLYLLEWRIMEMKAIKSTFSVLVIFTFSFFPLHAQHIRKLDKYISQIVKEQDVTQLSEVKPAYHLVHLHAGVKKSTLENLKISIRRTLGYGLLVVRSAPAILKQNRDLFREIRPVNNLWKLEQSLWSASKTETLDFSLKFTSLKAIDSILLSIPEAQITRRHGDVIVLKTSLAYVIKHLIESDAIVYVGLEAAAPEIESRVLDLYLGPNSVNKVHHHYPSINGEGSVISIRELQYDPTDIDIQGRHIASHRESNEISSHATDMATIAAGAGNSFINGKGVAWGAQLTSSDFSDLFPDRDEDYTEVGAWVQNHAYGTEVENFYGALAEAYDQNTNRLPELLHVFSSGNQGQSTGTGAYSNLVATANLTGNFKMSKNTLSVGAVDTLDIPLFFSSRGPAYDGRIKPEIVAYSTQGSSNAAALVSGVVSLLQQAYKQRENKLPAAALLKALLINSARDAGAEGIDFATGYGNVDAYRSIQNILAANYFAGTVAQGEKAIFELDIPDNASNLKVTLVWNDPAAQVNTSVALVNDLDIKVENGDTWLPWVLNASPEERNLRQPPQRNADHLNNVEQVTIEDPQPGKFTITVEGYDVLPGSQEFYVAYQWDTLNQLTWMFPTGSDNMPFDGETGTYFFWQSTLAAPTARLEYTTDEGVTWRTIAEAVELNKGRYRWNSVPHVVTSAQARFVVGSDSYPTETFTISRPPLMSIGFNCSDSVMLQWISMPGASEYQIQNFSDAMMKPVAVTQDTFLIINKNEVPSRFFAIQPVLPQNKKVLRSPLFDYQLLGGGCFLLSFVDEVYPQEGIYLNIQLGTIYGVGEIIVEHESHGHFEPIGTIIPEIATIRFLHDSPLQGLNRYRLRIRLDNGQEVFSDVIEDYFLTILPFIIFPNPVSGSGELVIFSKIFDVQDVTFHLYKNDGTLVFIAKIQSDREFVSLNNLAAGLYTYSITSEDGRFRGRIVVLD